MTHEGAVFVRNKTRIPAILIVCAASPKHPLRSPVRVPSHVWLLREDSRTAAVTVRT